MGFGFPIGRNLTSRFKPIKSRVERPFFEPQQPAPGFFESPKNLEAVGFASLQRRKDQCFEMTTQFVAVDGFHAVNIDRLGIKSMGVRSAGQVPGARRSQPPGSPI